MTFPPGADLALAGLTPPSGSGGGAVVTQLLFFAAIFAIFYFLLIRPQQRQKADRQRMLAGLKRGDRVVTSGGLHGTIIGLTEQTVSLRVADQVKLEFDRSAVGRVSPAATGEKDA
jgi:preprotein translocase subunit YajC